jgi:hypothetical protein
VTKERLEAKAHVKKLVQSIIFGRYIPIAYNTTIINSNKFPNGKIIGGVSYAIS